MRLLELALEKYGAFTGRVVAFKPQARLHVVFGTNEAGKTTALAAITDLLYGIEERTRFSFAHANEELRLGARIVARDGRELAFRRRKGRKNTLIDAADRPLPEGALDAWLGGVTRDVFQHSFGLSQEGLRRGGDAMLDTEGEVGRSVFAAGSGMTDLVELGRSLADDSEALFKKSSRGTTQFDKLRQQHEEARLEVRKRAVSFESWTAVADEIARCETRDAEIRAARDGIAAERSRLSRVRRLAPILARIDAAEARLAACADLPDLPPEFEAGFGACLTAIAEAERQERDLQPALGEIAGRLKSISLDAAILGEGARIDALVEKLQALRETRRDLPKRQVERANAETQLDGFARRLGVADAAAVLAAEPTDAARVRARRLLAEAPKLKAVGDLLRERRVAADGEIAAGVAAKGSVAATRDPAPLQRRFVALRRDIEAVSGKTELASAIERRRATLAERAARLAPPVASLDALATLPLPSLERARGFAAGRAQLDEHASELASRRRALEASMAAERGALAELAGGRDLPTTEALGAARAGRDRLWSEASRFVRPGTSPPLDAAGRETLAKNVTAAIAEADAIADRREAHSERLARHAEIGRRLASGEGALAAIGDESAALDARRHAWEADWQALWAPAGVAPASPGEMAAWLGAVAGLLHEREGLAAESARLDAVTTREAALLPALQALAAELGLSTAALPTAAAASALEAALAEAGEGWLVARNAARDLDRARQALAKLAEDGARHAKDMTDWEERWRAALPAIGLRPEAGEDEAEAALSIWSQVPEARAKRETARQRADAMTRTLDAARAELAGIVGRAAPEIDASNPVAAIDALRERLGRARDMQAALRQITEERDRAAAQLAVARRRQDVLVAERDTLARAAGRDDAAHLATLLPRLTERTACRAALSDQRAELAAQGDGHAETALRQERVANPPDLAETRLAALEDQDRALVEELAELRASLATTKREREALEGGRGAPLAAQDEAAAAAGLADLARRYALVEAARLLVNAAVDRHRARYQDPLVTRASGLFARLTAGSFDGLALGYRDGDTPTLVGKRPDGRHVPLLGLSEGTRDQLYLALRLAALAEFAARTDPLPLICDDLFVSFDDNRAALGLDALAEAGESLQAILFTHHRHIVDLAGARLGPDADIIEL